MNCCNCGAELRTVDAPGSWMCQRCQRLREGFKSPAAETSVAELTYVNNHRATFPPSVQDVHMRAAELIYNDDNECSVMEIRNLLVAEFGLRLVREAAEDVRE